MAPTTITISRATWRDTWTLWKLMRACFGRDAYDLLSIFTMLIWPGDLTLKAAASERMVGFISSGPAWGQDLAWIIALGVHPDFQRQGVAARLLAECESLWPKSRIRLTVRAGNEGAIALYHKMGYVEIGRLARYYADGEDGLEMEKNIGERV